MVLNTWEAVYFDHNLATLIELADSAAELGVERFVLDDGWFRGRRDDHAGLGDWYVDEIALAGRAHAADRRRDLPRHGVRALGGTGNGQPGLRRRPRAPGLDRGPVRCLRYKDGGRLPLEWRNQHVIDLVNPEAWQYIFDRIDALLRENNISYLKWDQNRDLLEHGHAGRSSVHEQTLAAYRLFDELRKAPSRRRD